jgi:acyl carrier protein
MSSTALETIRALLMQRFALREEELTPERPLATLGLDSLAVIELMFQLESALNISVPELPPGIETLGQLASFVDGVATEQPAQQPRR